MQSKCKSTSVVEESSKDYNTLLPSGFGRQRISPPGPLIKENKRLSELFALCLSNQITEIRSPLVRRELLIKRDS